MEDEAQKNQAKLQEEVMRLQKENQAKNQAYEEMKVKIHQME
jgi:hypothetical protein